MVSLKVWLAAARLRTLPLAFSGIILAAFLAKSKGAFSLPIFLCTLLTTVLLQVLSNFANDYGDSQNGADLVDRIGPARTVQSGAISPDLMLKGIYLIGILALLSGLILLYVAFDGILNVYFGGFLAVGLLAIIAAYTYTAGAKPYGYAGLGDISVFIFFGLVGVLGTLFLFVKTFSILDILPAMASGALATGVLNINNIRDINSDKNAGKITVPVRLGRKYALIYHAILIAFSMFSMSFYIILNGGSYYFVLAIPFLIINVFQVFKNPNPDPYLKTLALSSLFFSVVSGLSLIL
jgi:1,4-dihydroxy-2-naphthoate polyprenyltransferase